MLISYYDGHKNHCADLNMQLSPNHKVKCVCQLFFVTLSDKCRNLRVLLCSFNVSTSSLVSLSESISYVVNVSFIRSISNSVFMLLAPMSYSHNAI